MMIRVSTVLVAALLAASAALASDHSGDKPSFSASRTITLGATVTAIDQETREVTLERDDGSSVTLTIGPDIRNLAQVEAGDRVSAEVKEEVSVRVNANPEGLAPGASEIGATTRAQAGDLPSTKMIDSVVINAVVEEIDIESNTFKLRFSEDEVRQFEAANPDNLARADVGDLVIITVTQAVAMSVEHSDSD